MKLIENDAGLGSGMDKDGGQGDCIRGVLLSGGVSGFISDVPVSHIFGAITGIATCGSTMGQVVGVGDTYLTGIGWWLVFRIHHHRWDSAMVA